MKKPISVSDERNEDSTHFEFKMFSNSFGREVNVEVTIDKNREIKINVDGMPYSKDEIDKLLGKNLSPKDLLAIHNSKSIFEGKVIF